MSRSRLGPDPLLVAVLTLTRPSSGLSPNTNGLVSTTTLVLFMISFSLKKREMRERVVSAVLWFGDGRQWVRQDCTVWRLEDRRMEVAEGLLVLWADGESERFLPWDELSLTNCCLHSQNSLFVCWTIMRTCKHIYKGSHVIHGVWHPQDLV